MKQSFKALNQDFKLTPQCDFRCMFNVMFSCIMPSIHCVHFELYNLVFINYADIKNIIGYTGFLDKPCACQTNVLCQSQNKISIIYENLFDEQNWVYNGSLNTLFRLLDALECKHICKEEFME